MERRRPVAAPSAETEIRGEPWDGRDLSGQIHARVAFVDVDLMEVSDRGAAFSECSFRDSRFNVSSHQGAAFLNCTFSRCSFFDARFEACKLVGSTFERCAFGLLAVTGGDWSYVGLSGADLRGVSFTGVRMREVDLTGARCQGATLQHLDLSGGSLAGADFCGADLRGSDLSALDPRASDLAGVVIDAEQAPRRRAGAGGALVGAAAPAGLARRGRRLGVGLADARVPGLGDGAVRPVRAGRPCPGAVRRRRGRRRRSQARLGAGRRLPIRRPDAQVVHPYSSVRAAENPDTSRRVAISRGATRRGTTLSGWWPPAGPDELWECERIGCYY